MGFLIDTIPKINTHTADLDAHTKNIMEVMMTTHYLMPFPLSAANKVLTADRLYACPLVIARDVTIDKIAIQVVSAGAAGTKARLGLYQMTGNWAPGALVADYGTVDVDSTGGKAITIDPAVSLSKGAYFTALVTDGTPTIYKGILSWTPLGMTTGSFGSRYAQYYRAFTYDALPDPWGTADASEGDLLLVLLNIASLA